MNMKEPKAKESKTKETKTKKTKTKEKSTLAHKVLTVIGIILCIILLPVLCINCTLLVKSQLNKDSVPDIGGIFPLIVLTDSMSPQIDGGDMIICHTVDAADVQVGDVIAFFDPAGNGTSVVTHRVIEITTDKDGSPAWRTKGDANNTEDQVVVPFDKLVGKWSNIRLAGLGNVAMFMQTSTGLVVCVVIPLVLLVGYDILRRRIFEKKNAEDTEELMKELEELRQLKANQLKASQSGKQPEDGKALDAAADDGKSTSDSDEQKA